jgi:hypothetical protein
MQVKKIADTDVGRSANALQNLLESHGQRFPHQLSGRFPHIVKRLAAIWQHPDKARTYLKNLMMAERDGRQGFPPDVYQEIFILSNFYDQLHPPLKTSGDIWTGFSI